MYTDAPDHFVVLVCQGIGTEDLRMMTHLQEPLARFKDDCFRPAPVAFDEPPRYLDYVHLFSPVAAS